MTLRKRTWNERSTTLGIIGVFWSLLGIVTLLERTVRASHSLPSSFSCSGLPRFA